MRATCRLFCWVFLLTALLTGCGFHPRGNMQLAPPLKNLYLESHEPYSELSRNIKEYLKNSHVTLAASPSDAPSILEIIQESNSQQLLSVGGTQQTRQYNLNLSVTFQVTTPKGLVLIPAQTVTESQPLTLQADQILGGSNEQNTLYRQMRRAIVYTIMTRLSSQAATTKIMTTLSPPEAPHP
jgi:LPS-assembly lipoprotein